MSFRIGDKVIRNPGRWVVNDFDDWGRGEEVGVLVEPPFVLEPGFVDVRWSTGRCFEAAAGLSPAPDCEPDDRPTEGG